jgi:hypothetical protein
MKRAIILLFLTIFTLGNSAFAQEFKAADWLEDFAQLKREMSANYANLEWAIKERGLNLKQISEQTEASLQKARDQAEAQAAIDVFLRQFADSHLRAEWISKGGNQSAENNSQPVSRSLCRQMGYQPSPYVKPGVAFSDFENYRRLGGESSKYLPAGVLTLSTGKKIGVIRIALFMESQFLDLCAQAVAERGLTDNSNCNDECLMHVNLRVSNLLTEHLAAQVKNLKREKIDALVIDISSNGGGTNWYEPAARTLSAKTLQVGASGFIRHPHWTKQLKERLSTLEAEIAKTSSPKFKKLLTQSAKNLRADIAKTEKTCERRAVWENRKLECSLVEIASKPVLPYAKPNKSEDDSAIKLLNGASYYTYEQGVYAGELLVLIDQRTASSSEAFTAMLKDNGAAQVIGQPSMGAGCGYTNGGIETVLKNSGARIRMPDCVRFRADGTNEVAGITPDILIPWRQNDTPFQKAKRTIETIEKIFAAK